MGNRLHQLLAPLLIVALLLGSFYPTIRHAMTPDGSTPICTADGIVWVSDTNGEPIPGSPHSAMENCLQCCLLNLQLLQDITFNHTILILRGIPSRPRWFPSQLAALPHATGISFTARAPPFIS